MCAQWPYDHALAFVNSKFFLDKYVGINSNKYWDNFLNFIRCNELALIDIDLLVFISPSKEIKKIPSIFSSCCLDYIFVMWMDA